MSKTTMTARPVQAAAGRDLNAILQAAQGVEVSAQPGYYLVTFSPNVKPQNHLITKDKKCLCVLGADCPAVQEVAKYLKHGGPRASEGPLPPIPSACPICGGAVHHSPALTRTTTGLGWVCEASAKVEVPGPRHIPGQRHFIQAQWQGLQGWATRNNGSARHD
jgi:hypothetical protein